MRRAASPTPDIPVTPELLAAPPGDPIFAVLADQLLARGEPWGELVALTRARAQRTTPELEARLAEVVAEHGPRWWGDAGELFDLALRDGFVDALVMKPNALRDAIMRAEGYAEEPDMPFLDQPIVARLSRLAIDTMLSAEGNHGCWGGNDRTMKRLLARPRPQLRTLEFDRWMMTLPLDPTTSEARLSHLVKCVMHDAEISFGDLSKLWDVAPDLEHLVIAQGTVVKLGRVRAPKLRTLCLGLMPVGPAHLDALATAELPSLRVLGLRFGTGGYGDKKPSTSKLKRLLASPSLASLESLELLRATDADELLDALAKSPLFPRLSRLDLGGTSASEAAYRRFADASPRAAALRELWLSRDLEEAPSGAALAKAYPVRWREREHADLYADEMGDPPV